MACDDSCMHKCKCTPYSFAYVRNTCNTDMEHKRMKVVSTRRDGFAMPIHLDWMDSGGGSDSAAPLIPTTSNIYVLLMYSTMDIPTHYACMHSYSNDHLFCTFSVQ